MRKIIQISSSANDDEFAVNALCNDNTLWLIVEGGIWKKFPSIPQDGYVE